MPDRESIETLLGWTTSPNVFTSTTVRSRSTIDQMVVEDLLFITEQDEQVPAYFISPLSILEPGPALLYCHAHGHRYDIGRQELFDSRPALHSAYARPLTEAGYSVLCLDMPCFGERAGLNESATAKACSWYGRTLFGWMLSELQAGIGFLETQEHIDSHRIGVMGISMGGTQAWWLMALDERLRAGVSLCCFADLAGLIQTGQHNGHGHYMTVPGLLRHCSTAELAGLAAPRSLFMGVGLQDWSTPQHCFNTARQELESIYARKAATTNLHFHVEADTGHIETSAMRGKVLQFLHAALH